MNAKLTLLGANHSVINSSDSIKLHPFKKDFELELEITSRPRLILNIICDFKDRKQKFLELTVIKNKLEEALGFPADYGNQMKRIKFPLYTIGQDRVSVFDDNVALEKLDKIVSTLEKYITFN
jgi:hypothetical protein